MSGRCVVVIVKGSSILEVKFWLQVSDLYSKEGMGCVGSTCSCRGFYATIDRGVVWSQKQELGFPRLIYPFRRTLLRDIRICTKSWKLVSSRKLGFSNFICYAGLHKPADTASCHGNGDKQLKRYMLGGHTCRKYLFTY